MEILQTKDMKIMHAESEINVIEDGVIALGITFVVEDNGRGNQMKYHIPKIDLGTLELVAETGRLGTLKSVSVGMELINQEDGTYLDAVEMETTKKMTLEDIEKELGYQVEIVE